MSSLGYVGLPRTVMPPTARAARGGLPDCVGLGLDLSADAGADVVNGMSRATATHAAVLESTSAIRVGPQVLQVVLSLSPGGTERLVIELSKRLHAAHGMHVCCLDAPGAWAEELTAAGISVTALGRRPGFSPAVGRQIARIAAMHDATV